MAKPPGSVRHFIPLAKELGIVIPGLDLRERWPELFQFGRDDRQ